MALRANIPKLFADRLPYIDEIIFDRWELAPKMVEKLFNVQNTTDGYVQDLSFGGFGNFDVKEEGAAVSFEDFTQGYNKTYTMVTYAKGFTVAEEMVDDDRDSLLNDASLALANAGVTTIEELGANVFNNAFNSSYTGPDGKVLCATDHPLIKGSTGTNRPTSHADLTVTSLQAALSNWRKIKNESGQYVNVRPKYLLVAPDGYLAAKEIVGSAGRSDTADRVDNVDDVKRLEVVDWPWLTDTDAWFLVMDNNDPAHRGKFFWRKPFDMYYSFDDKTFEMNVIGKMRCDVDWSDWRWVYGTAGA